MSFREGGPRSHIREATTSVHTDQPGRQQSERGWIDHFYPIVTKGLKLSDFLLLSTEELRHDWQVQSWGPSSWPQLPFSLL